MIIRIWGQVRGGKNNVLMTRTGHRYPNPVFAKWRDNAVIQVRSQMRGGVLAVPLKALVNYWREDNRRRDVPALLDGIWHVLERAGVVKDDTLISEVHWLPMGVDKTNPHVVIQLEPR